MIHPTLYARQRCHMKLLTPFAVACLFASFALAEPRTQTFDTDPGWIGVNNRVVPAEYPTVVQDFGYSRTNHAGTSPGEMGGVVTRAATPAYYGDKIGALTLDEKLTASGTFAFTKTSPGAGVFV